MGGVEVESSLCPGRAAGAADGKCVCGAGSVSRTRKSGETWRNGVGTAMAGTTTAAGAGRANFTRTVGESLLRDGENKQN